MPYMYILRCSDGSYYVGGTWNLERRMFEHSSGAGATFTTRPLPATLVFAQEYELVRDAYEREKQVQGWSRRKREALIESRFNELPRLGKRQFDVSGPE